MNHKVGNRYQVPSDEDYMPGSDNRVLKNYLGITSVSEIESLEEQELNKTLLKLEKLFNKNYVFSSEDLSAIHEEWLGDIYPIGGKYRSVVMSKDGFPFAAPAQIERLMKEFEKEYLKKYTPCNFGEIDEVIEAISFVHVEFILIHPFREGNGRLGRLLASLMANQANLPPLDYTTIDQVENKKGFDRYIHAIQEGAGHNYDLMKDVFRVIVETSQR